MVELGGSVTTDVISLRARAGRSRSGSAWYTAPGLLFVPALLVLVPVFVVPTVILLATSFTGADGPFSQYVRIVETDLVRAVFLRSLRIAAIVTLISLVLAVPYASIALKSGARLRSLLLGAVTASLFFSVLVRAYAWLALLGHNGPVLNFLDALGIDTADLQLVNSPTGVIIGMVQYGFPFMVISLIDVMARQDGSFERAAAVHGAGPVRRFCTVTFPLLVPGVLAGSTIVFVTTLGYFVIPSILGSPRELMIGQLISDQVGTTLDWSYGAALSAALLVVTFAVMVALRFLARLVGRS